MNTKYIKNRVKEPSSWVGLGLLAEGIRTGVEAVVLGTNPWLGVLLGLAGVIGAVGKDPNNGRD